MPQLTVPEIDYVSFLLYRKYPQLRPPLTPIARKYSLTSDHHTDESGAMVSQDMLQEAAKYRLSLSEMPKDTLKKLYSEELVKKNIEDDQERFFKKPESNADFDYWSKMAHWKLDEALALSFGRNPYVVNENAFKGIYDSPFVREYYKLKELAKRAIVWKQIFDPVLPSLYIAWAKRNDISFPEELAALVEKRSFKAMDWKKMYDDLLEKNNSNVKIANEIIEQKDKEIEGLKVIKATEKPINSKERDTLLKMVIGMAVKGYAYDPKAKKSSSIKDISDDLTSLGISLDADTIRKWIKEAAEILPRDDS